MPSTLSYLSLLDILFATIGVFIVVLTAQLLAVRDHGRTAPDALVVLRLRGGHIWYTPPGRQQLVSDLKGIVNLTSMLSATLKRPARLVVAFPYEAASASLALENLVRESWHRQEQSQKGERVLQARFAWRPLESTDPDGALLSTRFLASQNGEARK